MKIRHACGLLVFSVLWGLLTPLPAQADAEVLEWVKVDKSGLNGNIVSPSEVSEIAVGGGGTIYALDSSQNATKLSKIYKSVNGGASWADITSRLVDAGAVLPASKIVIAPDTTGTVAVVTDSGTQVYLSINGGVTWTGTNVPGLAGTIQAIVISRQYSEAGESPRDIAIGTAAWGDTNTTGQLWVLRVGALVSTWQNQSLIVDPNQGHLGGEVSAIAYSPDYPSDKTIIAVASTGNDVDVAAIYQNKTWLCIGIRDTTAQTTLWNTFSNYPVEIATASSPSAGDAIGASENASLALPSDYSSADEPSRYLFVSYDRQPDASDDVYRLEDTVPHRLNANNGANIDISSIAYYGTTTSGKLIAGDVNPAAGSAAVQVRRTANPFDLSPTWHLASVLPSGPGNAKLNWSPAGDAAYCGTGQSPGVALDESAFSMSSDGDSWQQLSLMDTTITVSDIAPAPDSTTLFMASYSAFGPEGIWRSGSIQSVIGEYWYRLLIMDTTSNRIILRLSPDYTSDYTIYAAEAGGNLITVSHNQGSAWKRRRTPVGVIDVVVEDGNTLYAALPGGDISKSTNGAFTWGQPVSTGLPDINMLAIAGKGTVLVGGRNGEVAYSTDNGTSFTRIDKVIGTGDVQVVADVNYAQNGLIYATTNVTDKGIWRWTIGTSTRWEQIDESITNLNTGQSISGLAVGHEGTLYALRQEPAGINRGGMTRSLNPNAPYDSAIEFDFSNEALPVGTRFDPTLVFPNTLPHLKLSGSAGQNDLWAIDTANDMIYHFQDSLALVTPTLSGPLTSTTVSVNALNGEPYNQSFIWPAIAGVTNYGWSIFLDEACTEVVVAEQNVAFVGGSTVATVQGPTAGIGVPFMPGTTYYWRVRALLPISSGFSEVCSFTVESVPAVVATLGTPVNGSTVTTTLPAFSWAPIGGTNKYQFQLTDDASFAATLVDTPVIITAYQASIELQAGKTYFWRVKAIEPVESGWSAVGNFAVAAPAPATTSAPTISILTITVPPIVVPPANITVQPATTGSAGSPVLLWAVIIIGTVLVIVLIVLIVRTRRTD